MNRGNHEGTTGVSMYRYDNGSNTIVEKFYIPEDEPCEMLAQDLNRFSYLTAEDVVYMYLGGTIYSVNLMSGEARRWPGDCRPMSWRSARAEAVWPGRRRTGR